MIKKGALIVIYFTLGLVMITFKESSAYSCMPCMPPTVEKAWFLSDFQFSGTPLWQINVENNKRYYVRVDKVFKGCLKKGQIIVAVTPQSSAACELSLKTGVKYLINGDEFGKYYGKQYIGVTLCGYHVRWSDLNQDELDYLNTRPVQCGDQFYCAHGTPPVNCFADPCAVAPECPESETCVSNYCRGCYAEFYDNYGYVVCTNSESK